MKMYHNAENESYELVEVLGNECLFSCLRIDRTTVPEGLYAYDVRHDDECQGDVCEIKPHILVNHWGTIICSEPIEMTDLKEYGENFACRFIEQDDFAYTGVMTTLDNFRFRKMPELRS
jgi:hypothetical protein